MAVKVNHLSEREIEEIGEAFAYFDYADVELGMTFLYKDRETIKEYICVYTRAMLKAGCLYSTSRQHEAFIAFNYFENKLNAASIIERLKTFYRTMRIRGFVHFLKMMSKGGESYEESLKKAKKPYVSVGILAVPKKYQRQGYMRKVLNIAYSEGKRRDCPVVLATDAVLKRDKYEHLGMKTVRTRKFAEGSYLYDLAKEFRADTIDSIGGSR